MQALIDRLQTITELKQVSTAAVLAELQHTPLQFHQLPAVIVLSETETAEPNRFIGGHTQRVSVRLELLLLEAAQATAKTGLSTTRSDAVLDRLVKSLVGWEYDSKIIEYQSIEHVEAVQGLAQGQLMRKVRFGCTKYRKAVS